MIKARGFTSLGLILILAIGLAVIGGGAYVVMHKNSSVQILSNEATTTQAANRTLPVSSDTSSAVPTIAITIVSGRTITVQYANLSTTEEGPTPPKLLDVQSENFSKPTLSVNIEGNFSGTKSFTMPADAPAGNYTITPVGIPTKPYVGGVGPGWMSYGKSGAIVFATFNLSSSGSITFGTGRVSVPGMSKYTDADFGFSFWYPSGWKVMQVPLNTYASANGVLKSFTVANPNKAENGVSIDDVYSPNRSINATINNSAAGYVYQEYFFDTNTHTWMIAHDEYPNGTPAATTTADVSKNTMGGLHMFAGGARFGDDTIVSLSAQHFLVITTLNGGGYIDQRFLVKTIITTDPSVATPVSAAEQIKTIQAEKDAYAGQ